MGWVSFMIIWRKITATYRERTELQTARGCDLSWITCHKQSSFSSVSKKQYSSHELTWYRHIHVALCHAMMQCMLFNIVSSDDYFDFFFRNSKTIKIFRTFPQNSRFFFNFEKIQENENFLKFLIKIVTFSEFSFNYVHLAHAILYVVVADDLVPRFLVWIITYCVHLKQLKTIEEIWLTKLIIKIMPFEHQQQQLQNYNRYTNFTYIGLVFMVFIIYFIILKYISYISLLWFTIHVLVSYIFNCLNLVLFRFSQWNRYHFSNTKCSRSVPRIADRTRPQGLELSIMAGLLLHRFTHFQVT